MSQQETKDKPSWSSPLIFRGHIAALDGLRGVAVLMILLLHFYERSEGQILAGHPWVGGLTAKVAEAGRCGVPLFFVLSGFLITGILLDSKKNPHYFRDFYMRRFLRIFPLYYAVLGFILVILPHWVKFDPSAQSIVERQAWLWTYLSNSPWAGGGWNDSNQFLLGHFWSLCVEEHFYLVWPVVILTCKPEWVATTCLLLLTASLGRRVLTNSDMVMPAILSWTSISRLDGLFVGSLIAVCCRSQVACLRLSQSAGGASIVMGILFLVCVMLPRRLQNGLYFATFETITVFFFGSIATLALRGSGWIHSSMQNSFLRSFGKYSYGIYVIHFICLPAFERLFRLDYLLKALGSPLVGQFVFYCLAISSSYLLAFASWHLMEKHFLSYKRYFDYKTATAAIRA